MTPTVVKLQNVLRVIKVLYTIAFVFLIIGAVACALSGSLFMTPIFDEMLDMEGLISAEDQAALEKMGKENLPAVMFAVVILLISECITAWFVLKYLKNEERDGTPFTMRGSKELFRLGIIMILVPAAGGLISSIIFAVASGSGDFRVNFQLGAGLLVLFISLIVRHGAETEEQRQYAENECRRLAYEISLRDAKTAERYEASAIDNNQETVQNMQDGAID